MHKLKFLMVICLIAVCSISMASADNPYSAEEQEMLDMVNEERTKHGLSPLKFNPTLNGVSSAHSKEMIEKDYFSHNSYDGTSFWQRLKDSGYNTNAAAENIAMTMPFDVERAHEKLMASSGHRKNILNPDYNEIGIGIWVGNYTYNGRTYSNVAIFTQDFGRSESATEASVEPLSIESSNPEGDKSSYCNDSIKFSISTNRPCDSKWFVDGKFVKTSDNTDTSTYTVSKTSPGTYRVKVTAIDGDYTDTKEVGMDCFRG
jgi:uncharacterized protein YkwD